MPITRIKNNQVTDASTGNVYLGINAAVKLQDYSVTAGKIANSLVYGSDLTVSGNLTVNGTTTTIDTVSVVIEDPILYLAANQTGAPSLDIGYIGERGTSQNIAFVWDESAGEFVTVYTNDTTTNTTVTISSYADFHTNNANIGGNLTVNGTTNLVGNITLANISASGQINATGNISGGNLVSNANISAASAINATGNITGGNLVSNAAISAATTISATGNITGGNLISNALVSGTTLSISGNANLGNLGTAIIVATGNITTPGNIQAGNLISNGAVIGNVTISGNLSLGNLSVTGVINTTGNITGGNLVSNAAVSAATTVSATGNVTGGNIISNAAVVATGNITTTTGNILGGNIATTGVINTTGNITGGNLVSNAAISAATTISATGNITGGNLISNSLIQGSNLSVTGDALVAGNLTVQGNLTYINIDDLRVEDPIIQLGGGANGNALTTNDGKDRGVLMTYYTTAQGNAFMGWDNSSGNMIIAPNVSLSGEVVTVNQWGTFQAGNVYATGNITATGNIAGNFVAPGSNTQVMFNNNGLIAGDSGMTYNATTDALTVVGNIAGGNLSTGGQVTATANITGGNLTTTGTANIGTLIVTGTSTLTGNVTGNLNVTGNIAGGNILTNGQMIAVGNVTGGNIITTGNVNGGGLYITGNGTVLGTFTSTSNIVANVSGIFYGNSVTGNAALFAGVPGFTTLGSNVVVQFAGNVNNYSQINFENTNSGNRASTDYILTNDQGTDSTYFADWGIASSNHDDPAFFGDTGTKNDSYLYVVGNSSTGSGSQNVGNLILGSTNGNVKTFVGNTAQANVITTAATTGFYIEKGNLYTANITTTGSRITVNNGASDIDFAVNGTTANLIYVDAGTGTTSFGNSTQTTGAGVAFNYTNSILAPVGNTAQRPTGVAGMVRFNTTTSSLEFYDGTQWQSTGTIFTVVQSQTFNGDGTTVNFTINSGYTTVSCLVSINGILQVPVTAYAVAGTTLTFTEAPAVGDLIEVREIVTTVAVKGITNANGSAVIEVSDSTTYIQTTGNILPSANVTYNLGAPTARFKDLYLAGNSITLGNIILTNTSGNTLSFTGLDGTTPGTLSSNNVDTTSIANGSANVRTFNNANVVVSAGGTANVLLVQSTGATITGDLTVTGNATLSGNIIGDRVVNGTTSIEIQTTNGNANVSIAGTSNVAVFTSTGMVLKGDLLNGQSNGVGNIGNSTTYFNTAFIKATSAQYADLAENYEADAAYEPGTVLCFGGVKEVTLCTEADCTSVAGVVSTNPSYLMNSGQTGAYVAAVALQGRVPTKVTGQVRKGDLMVAAGDGRAQANNNARAGTIIGKSLADFDGQDGVIEVVVGRV